MIRQKQDTGVRRWFGDDWISMQNEIYRAIEDGILKPTGNVILSGCELTPSGGNTVITDGIVYLGGKLCIFNQTTLTASVMYLRQNHNPNSKVRQYVDTQTKGIEEEYSAIAYTNSIGGDEIKIDSNQETNRLKLPFLDVSGNLQGIPKGDTYTLNDTNILATTRGLFDLKKEAESPINSLHGIFNQSGFPFGNGILTSAQGVFVTTDRIYVTDLNYGVRVFDLENNHIATEDFGNGILVAPKGIFIKGSKAYVADSDGEIKVFNTLTGSHLAAEKFGNNILDTPLDIFIVSNKAYVTDSVLKEVKVFDITNGNHLPSEDFGNSTIFGFIGDIFILDNKAYITDPSILSVVRVFDVITKAQITTENITLPSAGSIKGIFIVGEKLYVSDKNNNKVFVFDLKTKEHLFLEDSELTQTGSIFIRKNVLYQCNVNLKVVFQNLVIEHI